MRGETYGFAIEEVDGQQWREVTRFASTTETALRHFCEDIQKYPLRTLRLLRIDSGKQVLATSTPDSNAEVK